MPPPIVCVVATERLRKTHRGCAGPVRRGSGRYLQIKSRSRICPTLDLPPSSVVTDSCGDRQAATRRKRPSGVCDPGNENPTSGHPSTRILFSAAESTLGREPWILPRSLPPSNVSGLTVEKDFPSPASWSAGPARIPRQESRRRTTSCAASFRFFTRTERPEVMTEFGKGRHRGRMSNDAFNLTVRPVTGLPSS